MSSAFPRPLAAHRFTNRPATSWIAISLPARSAGKWRRTELRVGTGNSAILAGPVLGSLTAVTTGASSLVGPSDPDPSTAATRNDRVEVVSDVEYTKDVSTTLSATDCPMSNPQPPRDSWQNVRLNTR